MGASLRWPSRVRWRRLHDNPVYMIAEARVRFQLGVKSHDMHNIYMYIYIYIYIERERGRDRNRERSRCMCAVVERLLPRLSSAPHVFTIYIYIYIYIYI